IGPLGLGWFALLVCGFVAVLHFFRGRAGKALTEVATSLVALMIASFIIGNPGAILRGAFHVESMVTSMFLSLGANTQQSPSTNPTLAPLKQAVVQTTVAKPYDLINWGAILTGRCAAIRDEALSLGPWGDAAAPRDTMKQAPECAAAASFNETGSVNRAAAAFVDLLNAVVSTGLLALVALVSLLAQLGATGLLAIAVGAAIAAIFPGAIRSAAWRWVEAAARVQIVMVVAAFVLSFWAILVTAVLDQMAGSPLLIDFMVMTCMTVLSIILFLGAIRRAPHIARNMTKSFEGKPGWVESKKSHPGAFGLGLGVMGLGEAAEFQRKLHTLMPNRKVVKAIKGLGNGKNGVGPGAGEEEFDPTAVPFPQGPGALSTTVYEPYGDGRWRQYAEYVKTERVPGRAENCTTEYVMNEEQDRLANPLRRPTITLPVSNPRKIQAALTPGGSQTPPVPAPRKIVCGGCGAAVFSTPGASCPLCGHRN